MRRATPGEVLLFTFMGQALLNIQVLEECLSASITLKVDVGYPRRVSIAEANELLKKRRKLTLGQAINVVREEGHYSDNLQTALSEFVEERNWFVHKSIDDIYSPHGKERLFLRIKSIAQEAYRIQRELEDDVIVFSESNGLDMSSIRAVIQSWNHHGFK